MDSLWIHYGFIQPSSEKQISREPNIVLLHIRHGLFIQNVALVLLFIGNPDQIFTEHLNRFLDPFRLALVTIIRHEL